MRQIHKHKIKIGIIGCGAIGSGIARFVEKDLKNHCQLTAFYDIDYTKASRLAEGLRLKKTLKGSLREMIEACDFVVEAVSAENTADILREVLKAGKDIMVMSVGKLLNARGVFRLAQRNGCHLLLPSGAVAGIDALKAAGLAGIDTITLTSRKPPEAFSGNPHLLKKNIDLSNLKKETVLFEGDVDTAVKLFPQNINVAATLALASGAKKKIRVCIITSPEYKNNSHEIEAAGPFGRITTRTDNVICPDNPKTSYLAVLSGMQTLRQFFSGISVGT
jgi:aspartate dehydrogenase